MGKYPPTAAVKIASCYNIFPWLIHKHFAAYTVAFSLEFCPSSTNFIASNSQTNTKKYIIHGHACSNTPLHLLVDYFIIVTPGRQNKMKELLQS